MNYEEMVGQLTEWLRPYIRYGQPWRLERLDGDAGRLLLATEANNYSIRFHAGRYLGCVATSRKTRPGETWLRGNDLPDGPFGGETFQQIMQGILAYEWRELVETPEPVQGSVTHPVYAVLGNEPAE